MLGCMCPHMCVCGLSCATYPQDGTMHIRHACNHYAPPSLPSLTSRHAQVTPTASVCRNAAARIRRSGPSDRLSARCRAHIARTPDPWPHHSLRHHHSHDASRTAPLAHDAPTTPLARCRRHSQDAKTTPLTLHAHAPTRTVTHSTLATLITLTEAAVASPWRERGARRPARPPRCCSGPHPPGGTESWTAAGGEGEGGDARAHVRLALSRQAFTWARPMPP